jgi:ketosteroid isomerase-like protein
MSRSDLSLFQSVLVGQDSPEIVVFEADLRRAQLAGDVAALDRLIADELLFTGPDGQLGTKAQDLDAHRSGAVQFREHVPEELRIRSVGTDVAVVALKVMLAVDIAGLPVRGTYRYTRVWARDRENGWQVVGGHVAPVPATAPAIGSGAG